MAMHKTEGYFPQEVFPFALSKKEKRDLKYALEELEKDTMEVLKLTNWISHLIADPYYGIYYYFQATKRREREIQVTEVKKVSQIPGIMIDVNEGEYRIHEECLNLRAKQDEEYIVGITDDGIKVHVYIFQKG